MFTRRYTRRSPIGNELPFLAQLRMFADHMSPPLDEMKCRDRRSCRITHWKLDPVTEDAILDTCWGCRRAGLNCTMRGKRFPRKFRNGNPTAGNIHDKPKPSHLSPKRPEFWKDIDPDAIPPVSPGASCEPDKQRRRSRRHLRGGRRGGGGCGGGEGGRGGPGGDSQYSDSDHWTSDNGSESESDDSDPDGDNRERRDDGRGHEDELRASRRRRLIDRWNNGNSNPRRRPNPLRQPSRPSGSSTTDQDPLRDQRRPVNVSDGTHELMKLSAG